LNSCKEELLQQPKTRKKIGSGRKPVLGNVIEIEIASWIENCNQLDLVVNHKSVRQYCLGKYGDVSTFSKDWFRRFKDRFKLSFRRVTSLSSRPKAIESSIAFEESFKTFREGVTAVKKTLLNMDETPVCFVKER